MADFSSELPIRTQLPGQANYDDVVVKIGDGTTSTQLLAVDSNGKITSKLNDGAGNSVTSQVNGTQRALDVGINVAGVQIDPRQIRALVSGTDSVSCIQSTSPWISSDLSNGSVAAGTAGTKSSLGGLVYNSTPPSLTTGQQVALQGDSAGNLKVVLSGTSTVTVSNLPTTVDTNYGTVGASTIRTASQMGNSGGQADFNAGATGAQTLRVVANQGAANTLANKWPVQVTDGTNTMPTMDVVARAGFQKITDGTNGPVAVKAASTAAAAADPSLVVAISPNSPLPTGSNLIGSVNSRTQDGSGTAITSGAQGAKQALDVELSANGALISTANPLPVNISSITPGTAVINYNTAASVAAAGTSNHDYTVTSGKTLSLARIWASASGKLKVEVQVETGVASGVFNTKFVGFNSTSTPNIDITVIAQLQVAAGVRVRVIRTNMDKQSEDVYSTIEGNEN